MKDAFLVGRDIALSISDSPDLAVLGLGREHLEDAMTEIARHLIACGATLSYGGDLRPGGFTDLLFEIVNRYRSDKDADTILVRNYLAYPVHATKGADELNELAHALEGLADLVFLDQSGKKISLSERVTRSTDPSPAEWVAGLTAMRTAMTDETGARVALGGQTTNYRGRLPGIAEEALIQLERKAPLFLLGGFGGCSFDIARAMGTDRRDIQRSASLPPWPGIEAFRAYGPESMHNGLDPDENRLLAETVHVDQAVTLILRGLLKLFRSPKKSPRRKNRRK
ncbi:hypothetical protein [Bradyrhizobium japonicum]|uniref:hypothetical protein n=1 Tax=Bradyrhizobium japonicum TaxID=375 RepID=UPI001BA6ECBD|nr:hypothetical protein [Bradyrhizobium japonicum]MBR0911466.1 hypothetical protein [Bradyrhizobium japonicum]